MDAITEQAKFLHRHGIDNDTQLAVFRADTERQIAALTTERKALSNEKRRAPAPEERRAQLETQISGLSAQLKSLRRDVRLCDAILNAHSSSGKRSSKWKIQKRRKKHMNQTGDAAEQIVNMATSMGLKGVEVVSNLAGKGAMSLATFLIAALKDQKRTKGKARMQAFNGKPTKVFVIKTSELKRFAEEARKYGVLYAAVVNRKQPDGLCNIVVNANDAAKVNRIAERFALSTVDVEKIREEIKKARDMKARQSVVEKVRRTPPSEKAAHTVDEHTLDEMLNEPQKTEHKQPADVSNPTKAGTERSRPSAPSSETREDTAEVERPSVRRQIKEIRMERQEKSAPAKDKSRQTTHKPARSRKEKTEKGR